MSAMDYYCEFWTEAKLTHNRRAILNVLLHPEKFPASNEARLWNDLDAIENALLRCGTVSAMQEICGANER